MARAIFVFSADPITIGHIDIISKASLLFDELIVGVGNHPDKTYLFSIKDRVEMARECLKRVKNIKVEPSYGLTVDFAVTHRASVIVRGVRTPADLDYEIAYAQMNLSQKTNLQTVFLPADPKLIHVSSTAVKGIQKDHGLTVDFVPPYIKAKLEQKISKQYFISITGAISAGKTTFSHELTLFARKMGVEAHNIEMDKIGHQILANHPDPFYRQIRDEIAREFGADVQNEDSSIDRKKIANIVFGNKERLDKLESIIYDPIRIELNRQTRNLQGLIFVTAALIIEKNLLFRSNNNVILVDAAEDIRMNRLLAAGFSEEDARNRMSTQWSKIDKVKFIHNRIDEAGYGTLIEVNTDTGYTVECLEKVWSKICEIYEDLDQDN